MSDTRGAESAVPVDERASTRCEEPQHGRQPLKAAANGGKSMKGRCQSASGPNRSGEVSWEFRLVLAVTFLACLVAAAVARCLPRAHRRRRSVGQRYSSLLGEARSMANTFAPFAFMG